jgi:hypothetical protein
MRIRSRRQTRQVLEIATAALLSLAGAATTFCSYQATLWSGRQLSSYGQADEVRTESSTATTRAGQQTLVDVTTFVAWLQAKTSGNDKLEGFVRDRLRPEFQPAFEEWLETDPFHRRGAPPTPFALPSYRLELHTRAEELAHQSEQLFNDGLFANAQADHYVLSTVIFAMALFFAGVGHQFRRVGVQVALLVIAAGLIGRGIYAMTRLPHLTPHQVAPPRGTGEKPVSLLLQRGAVP